MKPSPETIRELDTKAYRELCCYLEHAADAALLSDHTAVLILSIRDPDTRCDALRVLRDQLYSRKMAGGRVESWFIDCEERIRQDMPGFLQAAQEQFVRDGLDAEAAQMAAEKAKKQRAKPRILPASAFAPEAPEYLIAPYLPRGMLSILGGVSAAGKTSLALDIASAVSAGRGVEFDQNSPSNVFSKPTQSAAESVLALSGASRQLSQRESFSEKGNLPGQQKPPTLGEVASRSDDGEGKPAGGGAGPRFSTAQDRAGEGKPGSGDAGPLFGTAQDKAQRRSSVVFYLTAENDPNKVLRPRCEAMGADLDHLYFQNGANLSMSDPALFELCRAYRPSLVVFDPIQSFLGPGVQMNRAEQVRPLMDKLIALAKELDMAVLLISHMSKPGPGASSALDRLLGSSDFRNSARSILIAGADPEGGGRRVFAHAKNSLGLPGESQRYHIEPDGTVAYDGPCDLSADRLLMASADTPRPRSSPTLQDAADALDGLLSFVGWVDYAQVEQLCARRGFSERTMRRAKTALGLKTLMLGDFPNRSTYWYRAELSADTVQADILNQHEQLAV